MMSHTHAFFSLLLLLVINYFVSFNEFFLMLFLVTGTFFSLFPDIDEPKSWIGKRAKILSYPLKIIFGHRGFLHTIYPIALLAIVFGFVNYWLGLAVIVGYGSHLLLDGLTKSGIKPLWPLSNYRMRGPVKTGSIVDAMLFFVSLAGCGLFILNYI